MARRASLKPQLNQIRTWVGEGVTDIWIAHQLETTPAQVAAFRRQQGLLRPDETPAPTQSAAATPKPRAPRAPRAKPAPKAEAPPDADEPPTGADATDETAPKRRRRGRRGGRGRSKRPTPIVATIETTADGVLIRIDAALLETADFAEHWAERTEASVTISAAAIAIEARADDAPESAATDDDA